MAKKKKNITTVDKQEKRKGVNRRFLETVDRLAGNHKGAMFTSATKLGEAIGVVNRQSLSLIRSGRNNVTLDMLIGLSEQAGARADIDYILTGIPQEGQRGYNIPSGHALVERDTLKRVRELMELAVMDVVKMNQ